MTAIPPAYSPKRPGARCALGSQPSRSSDVSGGPLPSLFHSPLFSSHSLCWKEGFRPLPVCCACNSVSRCSWLTRSEAWDTASGPTAAAGPGSEFPTLISLDVLSGKEGKERERGESFPAWPHTRRYVQGCRLSWRQHSRTFSSIQSLSCQRKIGSQEFPI